MSFYSFRMPALQTWVACTLGGTLVGGTYIAYDVLSERRSAVPVFDTARIVATEEAARYPCTTLRGFDVVVKSFYVAEDAESRRRRARTREEVEFLSDEERAEALRRAANSRSVFSWETVGRVRALFSNDANTPSAAPTIGGRRVLRAEDDPTTVRHVVGDDGDARRALTAASTWPPGTEKYAALVQEPSASGAAGDAVAEHLRDSPLRWLADAATHQSLVRCRRQSPLVDMTCDADPTFLGATYLRVMLSAFLLLPSMTGATPNTSQPLRVAVLGVAGGSLPNFLQHYFSSAVKVMDLVDIEPACFAAAAGELGMASVLPPPDSVTDAHHRPTSSSGAPTAAAGTSSSSSLSSSTLLTRTHARDAADFLRENQRLMNIGDGGSGTRPVFDTSSGSPATGQINRPYDVLFVDMYLGSALAEDVTRPEFLRLCRQSLTSFGVAAFNLPEASKPFVASCQRVFGADNVYTIPAPGTSNVVVLARGGIERDVATAGTAAGGAGSASTRLPHLSHRVLFRRAQQLQQTYRLPYNLAGHFPVWWRFW